jgi:hypothetical protein
MPTECRSVAYREHTRHAGANQTAHVATAEGTYLSIEINILAKSISWPDRYLGEQLAWVLPHSRRVSYRRPDPEVGTCSRVVRMGSESPECREDGRLIEAESSAGRTAAGCSRAGPPKSEQHGLRRRAASGMNNPGNGLVILEPGALEPRAGIPICGWSA